jgi:hypothetical protein
MIVLDTSYISLFEDGMAVSFTKQRAAILREVTNQIASFPAQGETTC